MIYKIAVTSNEEQSFRENASHVLYVRKWRT